MSCKNCDSNDPIEELMKLDEEIVEEDKKKKIKKGKHETGCRYCGGLTFHYAKKKNGFTCDNCGKADDR